MADFQIYFQNGRGSASPTSLSYFTVKSMETITETMSKLFREVNSLAKTDHGWMIAWDMTAAERRRNWTPGSTMWR